MKLKDYSKLDIFRNITVLSTGTIIAQLIPIGVQPILRRLYSPEIFGNFAIYMGVIGVVVVMVSLRYEVAIVLPRKNADAVNLLFLSFLASFSVSGILFVLILLFNQPVATLLNLSSKYIHWLYFVPLSIFLFGTYRAINFWLIRVKAFRSSSGNKVVRRAVEASIQVTYGFIGKPVGMVIGDLLGNFVNVLAGILQLKNHNFSLRLLSGKRIREVAFRYREFPLYNLLPALLNTIATLAPVFFIKRLFTDEITGYFDLTRMVLAVPMALFSVSVSQALFQKLSEYRNMNRSIRGQILPVFFVLSFLAFVEILILFFFGDKLFGFVFGHKWTVSGEFAHILVFSFALKFIISPLSILLLSLEKIKIWSAWQVFYFLFIFLIPFVSFKDIYQFIFVYVIIDIIAYSIYAIIIFKAFKNYEKSIHLS